MWTGKIDLIARERGITPCELVEQAAGRSRTVNAVADELGVTTLTLRRWLKKHDMKLARRSVVVLVNNHGNHPASL